MDPWEERWISVEPLSGGGQGQTVFVRSKESNQIAIAKKLKDSLALDEEARTRMYQEVSNLRVVHTAQGKVPKFLDGNTEEYENLEIPLWFVMEKIEGETLDAIIDKRGTLSWEQATNLTLELYNTLEIGHQKGILHRDLKPENIMVRALDPADAVILDFGLSFNTEEPSELTPPTEIIDNKFLSLPEGRAVADNRRDPRSDLTCLCGILYYCLTGQKPRILRDSHELPPHRRIGFGIRDKMPDKRRIVLAEALFDKGFEPNIDSRFQTAVELRERIEELLDPSMRAAVDDPIAIALQASRDLRRRDRVTQLHEFSTHVATLKKALEAYTQQHHNKMDLCSLTHYAGEDGLLPSVDGVDLIPGGIYHVAVKVKNHDVERWIGYRFVAVGAECVVYRAVFMKVQRAQQLAFLEDWVPIFRFPGLTDPDPDAIVGDFKQTISSSIMDLIEQIAPQNSTAAPVTKSQTTDICPPPPVS
jgi:serine/threonine protein kinase